MQDYDKHKLYELSVQDPEPDIDFFNEKFSELRGRSPLSLREDFCGTGYLSTEWIKQSDQHTAVGIDLDPEAIEYGRIHHKRPLEQRLQKQMTYLQQDVLESSGIHADIVVALNFSFWFFKTRESLLNYFKAVRASMNKDSMFIMDTMGGTEVGELETEKKSFKGFTYYWECEEFNPITNYGFYSIHFKIDGQKIQKRAFTYDWRCWSIPEVRELLKEAGFSKSIVYWEGDEDEDDDDNEEGNGIFEATESAENCEVWVSYIAALP